MGLSEAGIVNQRMLAVLAGKPTGSSQINGFVGRARLLRRRNGMI